MEERSRIAEQEQTVAEQERTVRALELDKELGRAPVSEERLGEMQHLAETGRANVEELKEAYEVYSLKEYDLHLEEIQEEVAILKQAFQEVAMTGLTPAKLHMLHDGLDGAQERIQELDQHAPDAAKSLRRRALIDQINELRYSYPLHKSLAEAASVDLSRARELHHEVRATYAAVEQQLDPERREYFQGRIAQLAAQMRNIEHHHWLRLARMSRAKNIAPDIADAVEGKE